MGAILCIERVSRYVERKCVGRTRSRKTRIRDNRGIFSGNQERVWRREEELVRAAELRKLEQGGKMMEEFVQEFKRAARESGYKGRLLVEKFKREMNRAIKRKLMEAENQTGSIEQWYRRAIALNRN